MGLVSDVAVKLVRIGEPEATHASCCDCNLRPPDGNADAHTHRDCHAHLHADGHSHRDPGGDRDAHLHADGHPHHDPYGYAHRDPGGDRHTNGNADGDADGHAHRDSYGDPPPPTLTPTSPVANAIHVSDLDGEVTMPSSSLWNVVVTVRVHDAVHQPAAGVGVLAAWNDGSSVSCNTDGNGICRMSRNLSSGDDLSVSLTVNRIARKGWVYVADDNHDPDGDSDGVRIVIAWPSEVHAINRLTLRFWVPKRAAAGEPQNDTLTDYWTAARYFRECRAAGRHESDPDS